MSDANRESAWSDPVRLMRDGGVRMIKLEGGGRQTGIVEVPASHHSALCAHGGLGF